MDKKCLDYVGIIEFFFYSIDLRMFLYMVFVVGFLGTVSMWRGLWMLQMIYAYPKILFVSMSNDVASQMLLNLIYIILAILILWSLNLTSSLLSRASCEDDYFTAKKVYVLRFNNYKAFLHGKVNIYFLAKSRILSNWMFVLF